jgi:hypothetical protein
MLEGSYEYHGVLWAITVDSDDVLLCCQLSGEHCAWQEEAEFSQ